MDRDIDREFRAPDNNVQSFSALAGLACVVPLRFRKVIHGLKNPNDLKQYKMFVENDDMFCLFEFVKNKKTKACP